MANLDMTTFSKMLRSRLRLAEPDQQTDPLLKIPDTALEAILTDAIATHNPSYTLSTLPANEVQFVLWLAMIEVYYGIATQSAMYYQIEAQGAQLNKQQIFDHFSKLAQLLQQKYDKAWEKFISQDWVAQSVDVLKEYRYTPRSYRLQPPPTITLSVPAQTSTSTYLQWTPVTDRQIVAYRLFQYSGEIIDEYSPTNQLIVPQAVSIAYIPDIYRFKYRVDNLTPGEVYNFAVFVEDVYGHKAWSEVSILQPTTNPPNNTPNTPIYVNTYSPTVDVN